MGLWKKFTSWLTGRDEKESDVYANYDKVDDVVTSIKNVKTNQVVDAQDAIREALNKLNNVNGVAQYVGSVDTGAFDGIFDSIGSSIVTIADSIQGKADSIKEYEEAPLYKKVFSTIGMVGTKIAEGITSVVEDIGDAVVSVVGWTAGTVVQGVGAITGSDSIKKAGSSIKKGTETFVKQEWSHDLYDTLYYSTDAAKYSAITEDSGAAKICKLGGQIAGYVVAGAALSAAAPALAASSVSAVSAAGTALGTNAALVNATVAATAGMGSGVEAGLNSGKSLDGAMLTGVKQAAVEGVTAYALTKGANKLAAGKGATTKVADKADDVLNSTDDIAALGKTNTPLLEKADDVAGAADDVAAAGKTSSGNTADIIDDAGNVVGEAEYTVGEATGMKGGTRTKVVNDATGKRVGTAKYKSTGADKADDILNSTDDVAAAGNTSSSGASKKVKYEVLDEDGNVIGKYKDTISADSEETLNAALGDTSSGGIKGKVNAAKEKVTNAASNVKEKVTNAASNAKETFTNAGSKVVTTAKNAGSKVVTTAKNAGSKVVSTAASAGGKVGGAAATVATSTVGRTAITIGAGNLVTAKERAGTGSGDETAASQFSSDGNNYTPTSNTDFSGPDKPTVTLDGGGTTNGDDGGSTGGTSGESSGPSIGGGTGNTGGSTGGGYSDGGGSNSTPTGTTSTTDNSNSDEKSNEQFKKKDEEAENKKPEEDSQKNKTTEEENKTDTDSKTNTNDSSSTETYTQTVTTTPDNGQQTTTTTTTTSSNVATTGGGNSTYHSGGGYSSSGYNSATEGETETTLEGEIDGVPLTDYVDESTTSIDDIIKGSNKYSKIPTSTAPIKQHASSSGSAVIPIAAGLSAAAAAGIGAKAYIDRKRNNDNGEYDDDEFETDDWSEDDTIEISDDNSQVASKENYLDDDDDYSYEAMDSEKYGARNNEELADLQ